jgi:hypothetical protein
LKRSGVDQDVAAGDVGHAGKAHSLNCALGRRVQLARDGNKVVKRKKPAAVVEVPHRAPNAKPQTCSGCGESFMSDWSGHRVCAGCKSRPDWHLSNPFECDRSVALPRNGAPS